MPCVQFLLDQFPVELIFNVFTYLTANEIIHSFYNFSRYLRQCIRSYEQYKINFKSVGKYEFDQLCKVLRPDQIMALTLSDDEETPGQMALFFTRFPTFEQSFTRLEYLRIRNFEEFPDLSQMERLHTLTIDIIRRPSYSFQYVQIQQYDSKFAKIFCLRTLHTLIINKESSNIGFTFKTLPIAENLQEFKMDLRSIDNLPFILKRIPNIQKLTISLNISSYDNDFTTKFDIPPSLTHLTIKVSYGHRHEIKQIIESCSMLIYLNIHIDRNQVDILQWIDSDWWQSVIDEFLPQLKIFHLRVDFNTSPNLPGITARLEKFQTPYWTNNAQRHRSFTIGVMPFDMLSNDFKQEIISNKSISINLPYNELSILPQNRISNIEILELEHATSTNECYTMSDLFEVERYINNLSTLVHLKLDVTCTVTPSILSQLVNIAPHLTRLTISSFDNHLHPMMNFEYPQIRWLDMKCEYLPRKVREKFCSSFSSLEHLLNCYVYNEEDFEVLIENLKHLQNITVHIHSYYFDSSDEFDQWLKKHTDLKNFTFKLINERQMQLWIAH
ncbi:unnamed protein product [Adineta steineri]|uniref:F-box domain-containing protein n=1 Tax=Adineta steineri TaxID=433720 RepID=A0A818QJY3_9BILA|nr:unnamed protein product [Adineta steineri]